MSCFDPRIVRDPDGIHGRKLSADQIWLRDFRQEISARSDSLGPIGKESLVLRMGYKSLVLAIYVDL